MRTIKLLTVKSLHLALLIPLYRVFNLRLLIHFRLMSCNHGKLVACKLIRYWKKALPERRTVATKASPE